jgi:hypothetical protein
MVASSIRRSAAADTSPRIAETRTHLVRLDRNDWFRWTTTVVVSLLLALGVFSLSAPTLHRDWLDQTKLDINITGLVALVLLFAAYAAYKQVVITRLRRELTTQVGMAATLEVLRPARAEKETDAYPHREHTRFHVDLRISIEANVQGRKMTVIGRTSDLSEGGVGVVIPESLVPGDSIVVCLPIGLGGENMAFRAVVRHQRGFYHGCEFVGIGERERDAVRSNCAGALPVLAYRSDHPPAAATLNVTSCHRD